jgi:tetratricopeptide (TPR) repeat protein
MHGIKLSICVILLFLISPYYSFSQAFNDIEWYDVDSLLLVLPSRQGEDRLQTLNALAASLSFEDRGKCIHYANEAIQLADELGNKTGIAAAKRSLGCMEFYAGDYPVALNYFQEALDFYEQTDEYYLMGQTLEDMAKVHYFANNIQKSFELMFMARDIYRGKYTGGERVGDVRDTMTLYSSLGVPYNHIGRFDTTIKIYRLYREVGIKNNFEKTDMLVHLGLLARCYRDAGMYDSSIYYLREGMRYPDLNLSIKAMKNLHSMVLADNFRSLGASDSAIFYYRTSFQWADAHGFLQQAWLGAYQVADMYIRNNENHKAEKYFLIAEKFLDEMMERHSYNRYDSLKYVVSVGMELYFPVPKERIREQIFKMAGYQYDALYRIYLAKDELGKSMDYLIKLSATRDTLRKMASNRETVEIQTRYEAERKDNEIRNLSQDNRLKELALSQTRWLSIGLGVLVLLIVLLALVLIRQNRLRNSQQTLLLQQRLQRVQMNPHFMFNTLSSIQNYIMKENKTAASDYLSRFSDLMRQVLYSSTAEMIPLEDEIENIDNYLALQKIRYRDLFEYTLEVDETIDPESVSIPPMLAQPFIENAIEHGIKPLGHGGKIHVRIIKKDQMLRLVIEDNGIGREKAGIHRKKDQGNHRSMATKLTEERITTFNRRRKNKISMHIEDLKDAQGKPLGTRVIFTFLLHA